MTRYAMPVPVVAWLASQIGTIPGCSMRELIREVGSLRIPSGHHGMEITIEGRSPTLHKFTMEWRFNVDPAQTNDAMKRQIIDQIGTWLDIQRQRAAAGERLGHAFGLPLNSYTKTEVSHLHIDASALAIRIRALLRDNTSIEMALSDVRTAIDTVHSRNGTGVVVGGRNITRSRVTICEQGGMRIVECETPLLKEQRGGPFHRIFMHGRTITVENADIPVAIRASISGRPLREVVVVHPHLDNRIVETVGETRADDGSPAITLRLAKAYVPISDYLTASLPTALDLLSHHTGATR